MTSSAVLFVCIVLVMVVLFITEKLPIELTAILGLLALTFSGFIQPEQAFQGFSSPVVLTMAAVFVISAALRESGVTERFIKLLLPIVGQSELLCILTIMLMAMFFSSFMNNIAAVVLLLPSALSLAQRSTLPPSLLMIPLSFGAMLGGMTTLLGTPPNLLAAHVLQENGFETFHFFEFTAIGLSVALVGLVYMLLAAPKLLPRNKASGFNNRADDLIKLYQVFDNVFTVRVKNSASWKNLTLANTGIGSVLGVQVLAIVRAGRKRLAPQGIDLIEPGDVLLLAGSLKEFKAAQLQDAPQLNPAVNLELISESVESELESLDVGVAELMIAPRSSLLGRTIRDTKFRERYGCQILSIWRSNQAIKDRLGEQSVHLGDAILLQGPRDRINLLAQDSDFVLLNKGKARILKRYSAIISMLAFLGMVLASVGGLLPIEVAAVAAAALVLLAGVLPMQQAYKEIEWRVVVFVAALLPLGVAVQSTGLAQDLSRGLLLTVGDFGPLSLILILALSTSFLSQILDGAPAVVFIAPVALNLAQSLGLRPQPFLIAVALGASISFLAPFSHKAHLVVMNPGSYCSKDYFKIGLGLSVVCFTALIVCIAVFMPLQK